MPQLLIVAGAFYLLNTGQSLSYDFNGDMRILITGAAGNLGSLLARHLAEEEPDINLNLMIHRKNADEYFHNKPNIRIFKADLADCYTLRPPLIGVDVVIHFAGVLFKHSPEKFLPETNTRYFKNLLDEALINKVKRVILISFPHVEGETFKDAPAKGRLDGKPISVHAKTRLEEEKYLLQKQQKYPFEAVSLRVGMVYGNGILMIDAAKYLAKYNLLGVWKTPTWIHLISKDDFLTAAKNAATKPGIKGIYHVGDNGYQTLQEFLDQACTHWKLKKPWRMPVALIMAVAQLFEWASLIFGVKSPLTKDFIKIGMVSYYGDTSSMKRDLLGKLKYNTFQDGLETL
jgi:nucleoside-diphosphate-sugar epimerase